MCVGAWTLASSLSACQLYQPQSLFLPDKLPIITGSVNLIFSVHALCDTGYMDVCLCILKCHSIKDPFKVMLN